MSTKLIENVSNINIYRKGYSYDDRMSRTIYFLNLVKR